MHTSCTIFSSSDSVSALLWSRLYPKSTHKQTFFLDRYSYCRHYLQWNIIYRISIAQTKIPTATQLHNRIQNATATEKKRNKIKTRAHENKSANLRKRKTLVKPKEHFIERFFLLLISPYFFSSSNANFSASKII